MIYTGMEYDTSQLSFHPINLRKITRRISIDLWITHAEKAVRDELGHDELEDCIHPSDGKRSSSSGSITEFQMFW